MSNEQVTLSDVNTHWHSAFCAAAELGLSDNKEDLEFHREYNLNMEPLRIDLLVIEKRDDVQIVVTRKIKGKENRGLRILSRNALEDDIRAFINEAKDYTTKWARERVDAILQVSIQANFETYNEMRRRDPIMCEAMRTLMKDDIVKAQEEGEMKKARETAYELADMGLPVEKIAKAVKVSLDTVQKWLSGNMSMERP